MESKPIWQSKTFWTNLVALPAAWLGADVFPPDMQAEFVAGIMAAVNVVLRLVSKQPVTVA